METFYMVLFEGDGATYFFHNKSNAIKFLEESYKDDYGDNNGDEVYIADMTTLKQEGYIEDYAWIDEVNFEDER